MRILTPTENKRLNELIGFVGLSLAVMVALSLLSYSPHDASFNVSAPPPGSGPARNWIGPVGAHLADLVFQFCGYAAFLFPVGMFLVAMRWFRSQVLESPIAKVIGFSMLLISLSAELSLLGVWEVRKALPPGGLLGALVTEGLRAAVNPFGANLVAIACFFTALFLTTSFSFHAAVDWMKRPLAEDGAIGKLRARIADWREERESVRLRKKVEEIKIAGRPAVAQQRVSTKELAEDEEEDAEDDAEPQLAERGPAVIKFMDREAAPSPKKSGPGPKISQGKTAYKLPSPVCCRWLSAGRRWTNPN